MKTELFRCDHLNIRSHSVVVGIIRHDCCPFKKWIHHVSQGNVKEGRLVTKEA
jgi:hypothetical protein